MNEGKEYSHMCKICQESHTLGNHSYRAFETRVCLLLYSCLRSIQRNFVVFLVFDDNDTFSIFNSSSQVLTFARILGQTEPIYTSRSNER